MVVPAGIATLKRRRTHLTSDVRDRIGGLPALHHDQIGTRKLLGKFHCATEAAIKTIVEFAQRAAWLVIGAAILGAIASAYYVTEHFAMNTNTDEMLAADLPWRVAYSAYKREFPYFADTIAVVVSATTPDIARDTAAQLTAELRNPALPIEEVFFPRNNEFLRRHQFLYLDNASLDVLADKLSAAQPFLARLSAERSSVALFELLSEAADEHVSNPGLDLTPAMSQIATAIDELNNGDDTPMSWQRLILDDSPAQTSDAATYREIIIVKPHLDFGALLPAGVAIGAIRDTIHAHGIDRASGVSVQLTGDAALAFDELKSVITGSQNAGTLALIMVLGCLLIGLRSLSLVVATLTSLIIGLIFTATFAIACVGTLNMISIAFAVLYVGLGVDFAIHICLRYRELVANNSQDLAVNKAARHVGVSLILCAITTAIGFFAFIPTAYRGVAELGLIAGVGMFISLLISVLLLPALLHVLPPPRTSRRVNILPSKLAALPQRHARSVLGIATVIWVLAALSIPGARFDNDPINLNNPNAESVRTYRTLLDDPDNSPLSISVIVESATTAGEYREALEKLPEVDSVHALNDYVPNGQPEKLATIDDLSLILGSDLEIASHSPAPAAKAFPAMDLLHGKLQQLSTTAPTAPFTLAAKPLAQALGSYLTTHRDQTHEQRDTAVRNLDHKLLTSFDGRLTLLADSLTADVVTADNLPTNIRNRWLSNSGVWRLEVHPTSALTRPGEMKRFVDAVTSVVGPNASGTPVINIGAGRAVTQAFIQAFCYAFVLITALLWIILRSFKETAIVLTPLVLAGLITVASAVVLSHPFNFANIIALPLLLGVGVDSALHILHRYKTALPSSGNLLQTSTARGVLFSALTTIVSFGNLATSTHAGTATMGVMLSIGVVSTLICTLLVLPAMLTQFLPQSRNEQ